ncbi:acyltransferase [Flavivirga sp. Y03]|uniref:Acyltransferase n=2 Tax=Flavivirga algicola TaxID=2729136 RepID=A0ABX1RTM6_9FLAO|nr:acyltransferase [Flavivirga algicola]
MELQKNETKSLSKQALISDSSVFYRESSIENLQNDKSNVVIGDNTHIRGGLLIFKYGGKIVIGNHCYVGEGARLWSGESLTIGNNVLISHNVSIVDTDSHEINYLERAVRYKEMLSTGHWETKGSIKTNPIIIKDYAWINFGASILKGVTVGKGAIIGAGSVVTKDVPDWTIVAGNPAQIIRTISESER